MKSRSEQPGEKSQPKQCLADFSRSCEGCENVRAESWGGGKICYRCFGPGRYKGYVVGVERFKPYIPAWCPKKGEVT